jgi:hypothetical protein
MGSHALHHPAQELVGDAVVNQQPLHRDAQLPGVGEHRPLGPLHRSIQIRVVQDDHRVLAAQLHRARDQPLRRLAGDRAADLRAAGEHHVVHAIDQLRPEVRA